MSQTPEVGIVSTGVANTASVVAAFRRLGVETVVVDDWRKVVSAQRLVLPGVGSFGHAMQRLRDLEMVEPLRERILSNKPTLAICLGLQLFCKSSEESPGIGGLAVLPSTVRRFDQTGNQLRVPHLGWNGVRANRSQMMADGLAYFAHSYRIDEVPQDWETVNVTYGRPFVAAIEKGNVLACQFHPELSGTWGRNLLSAWMCRTGVPGC